jgi:predicted ATPase
MKRFILTGAPGAGKTAILRQLEVDGFGVVEEAATDVIALEQAKGVNEPWTWPSFLDAVVDLQRQRLIQADLRSDTIQFHDRSVLCTAALAAYLGFQTTPALAQELDRIRRENIYERKVFFIRGLGFIAPTAARRISFEEAQRFERIHEGIYTQSGFEIASIEPGDLQERAAAIKRAVAAMVR